MSELLLPLAEARSRVVAAALPRPAITVAVGAAQGRVLAERVVAEADVPGFANSAMDGWALRPGPGGRELRVVGEARAGHPATVAVGEGEAVRISTGAPLPRGAAAVVPVEGATATGEVVVPAGDVAPGANVRGPGEDVEAGAVVLEPGTRLGPAALAMAVVAGRGELACHPAPRVAVLATGDELVAPGAPLGPGLIHNSNAVALAALARAEGARTTAAPGVGDDRPATEAALRAALEDADVVLVSGGVSVGEHDHVRPALQALGVVERFWRVALRPGKPAWFGTRAERLVFGLPGNPVSAMVCFLLFSRPALRGLQGLDPLPVREAAELGAELRCRPGREEAVRVTLRRDGGRLVALPTGAQGSHRLSSMLGADALAFVPPGEGSLPAGATVPIERI